MGLPGAHGRGYGDPVSPPPRPLAIALPLMLGLALLLLPGGRAAWAQTLPTEGELLRGPYPFALANDLTLDGGYAKANGWSGARVSVAYGYTLAGSLCLALQIDTVSAGSLERPAPPADCTRCGEVSSYFDVLAGLKYKLSTPIPLVPYAAVVMGPVFLFHERARGAMGIAVRTAVGARYFLYEWLGVGMELGGTLGAAAVDETAGLASQVRLLDINLGAQVAF